MLWFNKSFKDSGILGMNARNMDYVLAYNDRKLYPLVDDKLETKRLAEKAGISMPELYCVIEHPSEVAQFDELMKGRQEFVIKPAHGSGGAGILVITETTPNGYRKASGSIIPRDEVKYHITNVLSGLHSLSGQSDKAIVEYRISFDPMFSSITYQGVPDIRILVFCGVPVMGMLRLPTRASDGKANLHMGGVGVGLNMADGTTLSGVQRSQVIEFHPDTGNSIRGHTIPQWKKLLAMASTFYDITGLGYIGVDIVLDKEKGPMVLEANARPGLAIQVANQEGLLHRLHKVEQSIHTLTTVADKVAFAQEQFGVAVPS